MKLVLAVLAMCLVGCGKTCFWCKENVKKGAHVCKYCGKNPDGDYFTLGPEDVKELEAHQAETAQAEAEKPFFSSWKDGICTVLCVGACLAIFILALLNGSPPDEGQKGMEQKLLEKAQKTQSYGKEWIECGNCGEAFDSRNDLFKHLKECPFGEEAESNPTEAESEYVVGAKKPVNAPAPPPQTNPAAKPTEPNQFSGKKGKSPLQ